MGLVHRKLLPNTGRWLHPWQQVGIAQHKQGTGERVYKQPLLCKWDHCPSVDEFGHHPHAMYGIVSDLPSVR